MPPLTLNALVTVNNIDTVRPFISLYGGNGDLSKEPVRRLLKEINRTGIKPSYARPTLFHAGKDLLTLMVNHEYSVLPYDAKALTEATIRSRDEVNKIVDGLRKLGGPWSWLQPPNKLAFGTDAGFGAGTR